MAKPKNKWSKSSPDLVERFARALPDDPRAERRQMFGYPCCFVNGTFFVGLHEHRCVTRLPGDVRARFAELAGAEPFDPMGTGRGLKDWFVIPAHVTEDDEKLATLIRAMFSVIVTVKAAKKKSPKKKRRATSSAGRA